MWAILFKFWNDSIHSLISQKERDPISKPLAYLIGVESFQKLKNIVPMNFLDTISETTRTVNLLNVRLDLTPIQTLLLR